MRGTGAFVRLLLVIVAARIPGAVSSQADHSPTQIPSADLAAGQVTSASVVGIPPIYRVCWLTAPELPSLAIPLPQAQTVLRLAHAQVLSGSTDPAKSQHQPFAPGIVLVKFKEAQKVAVLRVEPGQEPEARQIIATRSDVSFAELDHLQERQFLPNDPRLGAQWHHAVLDTFSAWTFSLGNRTIRIGIVDDPFQMNHPDLVANVVPGWSVASNAPVTESTGTKHATLGAGLAAAVINNGLGVAGVGNFSVLPIHITGFTSELYNATLWAATNDVRIVSASWSGADQQTLNEAGAYLRETGRGLLFMAGVNGTGLLGYPAQPDIWCVSMTDAADNLRSHYGDHIDFAAPGFEILSTTVQSGYQTDSGTSYSTPLAAGVAALMLAINPTLDPGQVIDILKTTADDLGPPGPDRFFGWGRLHAGRAAAAARDTLPRIHWAARTGTGFTVAFDPNPELEFSLWSVPAPACTGWIAVGNAILGNVGALETLTDPNPPPFFQFYQIKATRHPHGTVRLGSDE